MDKKYLYDAFISYRHVELDSFVAQTLHKYLESVKYPINKLEKSKYKDKQTKISRIFRDKDELALNPDLAETIVEALEKSKYLIVICSPQYRESEWCKRELNTFIKIHGYERVLVVLADGEPQEIIPKELLCTEATTFDDNGNLNIVSKRVEPLAADVRGKTYKEIKKKIKVEVLRVAAAILGCNYDELKQRHKERKIKRIIMSTLVLGGIGSVFGIIASAMAFTIKQQNITINEQYKNALLTNALTQSKLSEEYLEEGKRIEAIETTVNVLGGAGNAEMPYLAEVEYALSNSMYIYKMGEWEIARTLETRDDISFIKVSPKANWILAVDKNETLYIWETATGKLVYEAKCSTTLDTYALFVGEEAVFYRNDFQNIVVYDLSKEKIRFNVKIADFLDAALYYKKMNCVILATEEGIKVIDAENGEEKNCILYPKSKEAFDISLDIYEDKIIVINNAYIEANWVALYDIDIGKLVEYYEFSEEYKIEDAILSGEMIYIISDNENFSSSIHALNLKNKNGACVWEYKNADLYFRQMQIMKYEEKEYIVCIGFSKYIIFDAENGEIIAQKDVKEQIVYLETMDNGQQFLVYTECGKIYNVLYLKDLCLVNNNILDFYSDRKMDYIFIAQNFLVAKAPEERTFQIYEYFIDKNFNKLINWDESVINISVDEYGEYMAIESYPKRIIMVDTKESKILWSKDIGDNVIIENMLFMKDEEEQMYFVLITSEDIYLIDVLNGRSISQYNKEEQDPYAVFDYDYLCTSKDYKDIYLGSICLKKVNIENKQINITKIEGGNDLEFATVSLDKRYIVFIDDRKQELYIGDVEEDGIYSFSEEFNVAYIDKILWPAESEFFYVVYEDNKIELFHFADGKIKKEKEVGVLEFNKVENYFVDENGVYEVITGSLGGAYILKDNGIVAKIDSKVAVDFWNNRLFAVGDDGVYSINIYSTEELYEEAMKILGK